MTTTTDECTPLALSDPVDKHEIAEHLGVSLGTVYDSLRKFRAAIERKDYETARHYIPSLQMGEKGARFIVPRSLYLAWYESAGLSKEDIAKLYGGEG